MDERTSVPNVLGCQTRRCTTRKSLQFLLRVCFFVDAFEPCHAFLPQDQRVDPDLPSLQVLRLARGWSGRWESNPNLRRFFNMLINHLARRGTLRAIGARIIVWCGATRDNACLAHRLVNCRGCEQATRWRSGISALTCRKEAESFRLLRGHCG